MAKEPPEETEKNEQPPKYINLLFLRDEHTHLSPIPFPGMNSRITIQIPEETRKTRTLEQQIFLAHIMDYSTVKGQEIPIPFSVGVLGHIRRVTATAEETLECDVTCSLRIRIKVIKALDDGTLRCGYTVIVDKIPSAEEFASEGFQANLTRLKTLTEHTEGLVIKELTKEHGLKRLAPDNLSETLDRCASVYNMLFAVPGIEKLRPFKGLVSSMLAVLAEPHVERRLEKVIGLVEYGRAHQEIFQHYVDYHQNLIEVEKNIRTSPSPIEMGKVGREEIQKNLEKPREIPPRPDPPKRPLIPSSELVTLDWRSGSAIAQNLRQFLDRRIVNQDRGKQHIVRKISLLRTGLKDPRFPIIGGCFIGPTGVGKTEMVHALAEYIFGSQDAITVIEGNTLQDDFTSSVLTGAPPGYIGHDKPTPLTQWNIDKHAVLARLRKSQEPDHFTKTMQKLSELESALYNKYGLDVRVPNQIRILTGWNPGEELAIILFDEIEKASHTIFEAILGLIDGKPLRLREGTQTHFRNTIIFFTSNGYGRQIQSKITGRGHIGIKPDREPDHDVLDQEIYDETMREAEKFFSPEFFGRIHKENFVVFHPSKKVHLFEFFEFFEFPRLIKQIEEHRLEIFITYNAETFLVEEASDKINRALGMRAVQSIFIHRLVEPISLLLEKGENGGIVDGDHIVIDVDESSHEKKEKEIVFRKPMRNGKK